MPQTNIPPGTIDSAHQALDAFNGLFTVRTDVTSCQLHDEAQLRQNAAVGMLHALSSASDLNTLENHLLLDCIMALRLLCSDAAALYSAACERGKAENQSLS
ncbi:TPA: hypothetical protein ACVGJ9_005129 [Pseudomonas aeruginosa]|uniref:hypothetical protein n=1 Tax=Pseudomonas aeruginosa TaxID=287 RepID=UPI0021D87CB5|nr:hypothetical protein [Pseudomonas aeruginosa]MCU9022829.1 hypothetical protein [Pseudomonas aeruginosa]MDY1450108.1 hypothetical protein [Pseudomonas aeruginosa]